jgi:hypothetical protein
MKRNILFFLLISAAVFRGFGETSGDDKGKGGQGGAGSISDVRLEYMQEGINALWEKIDALQRENDDLRKEINALKSEPRKNSGAREDSLFVAAPQTAAPPRQTSSGRNPAGEPKPGGGGGSDRKLMLALYITIFVLVVLLVICLVSYIHLRRQDEGKKDRAPSREKRESRQDSNFSSYGQPGASRPASSFSSRFGAEKTGDVPPPPEGPDNGADYWSRWERPAAAPAAAPERPPDAISPLYRSRAKRDKRRDDGPGDMFLDVTRSVLERLGQGEKIQPILERSGTRLSAQFVLVDNKLLYPNFHIYNETNGLSKGNSNVLSMIYNLKGKGLPGFVESCMPAIVSPRGDTFAVTQKGDLKIS